MGNPRQANGHRRRQVVARVLCEETDCWLCHQPVDKTLHYLNPYAPEVDEVVPVSLGGSPIDRRNCRLAHRLCNQQRGNGTRQGRRVVLICGPAGAGKTTLAHTLGLQVYDVDEPQWTSETQFKAALKAIAQQRGAQAAVIRSAATLTARTKAAQLCKATEVRVLETDLPTCIQRIKQRGRTEPPLRTQIAAAQDWWNNYEPGATPTAGGITAAPRVEPLTTTRSW